MAPNGAASTSLSGLPAHRQPVLSGGQIKSRETSALPSNYDQLAAAKLRLEWPSPHCPAATERRRPLGSPPRAGLTATSAEGGRASAVRCRPGQRRRVGSRRAFTEL